MVTKKPQKRPSGASRTKRKPTADAERDTAAKAPLTALEREPIAMSDTEVETALVTGEHSGLLEDFFGPVQYAELRRMSQQAAARSVRGGKRVLILPGIMGSKLGFDRFGPFDDVIWADPFAIALGRLTELSLAGGPKSLAEKEVSDFGRM